MHPFSRTKKNPEATTVSGFSYICAKVGFLRKCGLGQQLGQRGGTILPRSTEESVLRGFLSEGLVLIGGDVLHDIFHTAVKNAAEIVDGRRIQGLVFAKFVDCGTGNMMFGN